MTEKKVSSRENSRIVCVMLMYSVEKNNQFEDKNIIDNPVLFLNKIINDFDNINIQEEKIKKDFIQEILSGVMENNNELESIIKKYIKEQPDTILQIILKLAIFEIINKIAPVNVIISQYLNVTSEFYENKKHLSFVNGVLDRVARCYKY